MIDIRNLKFQYSSDSPEALRGINLTIPERSFTAVMGSNGSGKSTLARCLNGLLSPSGGVVRVDEGEAGGVTSPQDLRRRVGLVFQNPNLQMTSLTVERELAFGLENIGTGHDEMHTRVDRYVHMFGLERRRGDPPSSLSAGEKQRLAIASVMILQPSYLVLDEATSLLAAASRTSILDMIAGLRGQLGVILITQYPSEARLCERLIVLNEGCIVFDDSPDNVFRNGPDLVRLGVAIPIHERLRMAV